MPKTEYVPNTKMYTETSNFQHRWTKSETIRFLGLLKRYPILVHKCTHGPGSIENRKVAMESLLEDSNSSNLEVRDLKALKSKIDTIKTSFTSALATYQEKIRKKIRNPKTTLTWFDKAHFLDTSGYLRKLKEKRSKMNLQTKATTKPAATSTPMSQPPPQRPSTSIYQRPLRSTRSATTAAIPATSSADRSTGTGIKVEVNMDYNEDGEDAAEDEEEEEFEQGEFVAGQRPAQHQAMATGGGGANHLGQTPQAHPPQSQNYYTAFLEYTYLRTRDYSGRQKREIINALTSVMNSIDEENESTTPQNYSIQMYSSYNDYKE